jgi:hypothetical protein
VNNEKVVQLQMKFEFGQGETRMSPKQKCYELAKQELGPNASPFALTVLTGKIYRASFGRPMWTEEPTEEPKSKVVAAEVVEAVEPVAAADVTEKVATPRKKPYKKFVQDYSNAEGVKHYGPEGGWVLAAGV